MISAIGSHWISLMNVEGGDMLCLHRVDTDEPEINSGEYTGTIRCVDCGALLHYDVSDIGD